jgi:hypothetical protein
LREFVSKSDDGVTGDGLHAPGADFIAEVMEGLDH